jgi:hypothetical protein
VAGYAEFFLILRGKTDILLVAELETEFDSDNWLHFQSVVTHLVGEERAAQDTFQHGDGLVAGSVPVPQNGLLTSDLRPLFSVFSPANSPFKIHHSSPQVANDKGFARIRIFPLTSCP